MIVDWPFLLHFLLSVMNLSIAVYVLLQEPRRLTNQVFAFFGAMVSLWALAIGFAHNPATATAVSVRATFAAASLMLVGFLTLILAFPSASSLPRTRTYLVLAATGLAFSGLAFTSLLVGDAKYNATGLTLQYGPLHRVFALYTYLSFGYALIILLQKLRSATGFARLQLRYLFMALLLPGIAITITNLLIPLVTRVSTFGRHGPAFTLVFLALTAHTIIRHRLMNIRLIVSRSVASLLAVLFSAAVFLALVGLASFVLSDHLRALPLWLELTLVFPIALLFPSIRSFFRLSLDRYFYRRPYDYERTIREASRTISASLHLPRLLHYVCKVIGETIRPEHISVYLKVAESAEYRRVAEQHLIEPADGEDLTTLPSHSSLIALLANTPVPILREDIVRLADESTKQPLLDEVGRLRADYLHPIFEEQNLAGLLVLGQKLSGDPYFTEDIDLLTTLAGQAAIAIRNAQLYRQVVLANEHIENILATMESGVIAVAADGNITLFNPASERLTGRMGEDVKGRPLDILPTTIATYLRGTLTDRRPRLDVETVVQKQNGDLIPIICSTAILADRTDDVLGAIAVLSDLTMLKQLEAEKRRVERLASIGAIASGFAHEIKNPLVAIKTFAELLPERFNDDDFRNDFSKLVIREIDRIDGLVARLRGRAAPAPQQFTRVDLRDPIEETLSLLRGQLELSRITPRIVSDVGPSLISGDRAQLKQLFLNLFMNAIEAMESGGVLAVSLKSRETLGHPTLVVEVSDSGVGIPHHILSTIFDPFVTTKSRGSGLGLSICRGIADAHRASIRAENNPGVTGATIILEFPALTESSIPASHR